MMRIRSWIVGLVVAGFVVSVAGGAGLEKKIIKFGWDMKTPADLPKSIGDLQHLPFDGLTISDKRFCYTFYNEGTISEAEVQKTIEIMKNTAWGKFTDNFMYMTAADNVDWFDDAVWTEDGKILTKVRALARIGQAGGARAFSSSRN